MFAVRFIVIGLICAVPVILLADGPVIYGLVAVSLSTAAIVTAVMIRIGEADFVLSILWPIAAIAVLPAFWIFVQILPLSAIGLSHPIWESATVALGYRLAGSISIDTGASVIALGRYLSAFGVFLVSLAVAADRQRAEGILIALMIATTAIAIIAMGLQFFFPTAIAFDQAEAMNCIVLGVIVAFAGAIRVFGRLQTERKSRDRSNAALRRLMLCGAAIAICLLALLTIGTLNAVVAVAFGITTLMIVVAIRYFNIGRWGISAIAVATALVVIALIANQLQNRTKDITLAFAAQAPTELVSATQRILADTPWTGTGAGTYAAIAGIYRDANDANYTTAPTAAATTFIELGRFMLWGIVAATLVAIVALLRGALLRGRDSFYPACGAGCLAALLVLAFCNAGLYGSAISIIAMAVLGLAFGQSKGRAIPQPIPQVGKTTSRFAVP